MSMSIHNLLGSSEQKEALPAPHPNGSYSVAALVDSAPQHAPSPVQQQSQYGTNAPSQHIYPQAHPQHVPYRGGEQSYPPADHSSYRPSSAPYYDRPPHPAHPSHPLSASGYPQSYGHPPPPPQAPYSNEWQQPYGGGKYPYYPQSASTHTPGPSPYDTHRQPYPHEPRPDVQPHTMHSQQYPPHSYPPRYPTYDSAPAPSHTQPAMYPPHTAHPPPQHNYGHYYDHPPNSKNQHIQPQQERHYAPNQHHSVPDPHPSQLPEHQASTIAKTPAIYPPVLSTPLNLPEVNIKTTGEPRASLDGEPKKKKAKLLAEQLQSESVPSPVDSGIPSSTSSSAVSFDVTIDKTAVDASACKLVEVTDAKSSGTQMEVDVSDPTLPSTNSVKEEGHIMKEDREMDIDPVKLDAVSLTGVAPPKKNKTKSELASETKMGFGVDNLTSLLGSHKADTPKKKAKADAVLKGVADEELGEISETTKKGGRRKSLATDGSPRKPPSVKTDLLKTGSETFVDMKSASTPFPPSATTPAPQTTFLSAGAAKNRPRSGSISALTDLPPALKAAFDLEPKTRSEDRSRSSTVRRTGSPGAALDADAVKKPPLASVRAESPLSKPNQRDRGKEKEGSAGPPGTNGSKSGQVAPPASALIPEGLPKPADQVFKRPSFKSDNRKRTMEPVKERERPPMPPNQGPQGFPRNNSGGFANKEFYPGLTEGVLSLRSSLKRLVDKFPEAAAALEDLGSDPFTKRPKSDSPATGDESKSFPFDMSTSPDRFSFRLKLPTDFITNSHGVLVFGKPNHTITLTSCQIFRNPVLPTLIFEECYEVPNLLPRSYYTLLHKENVAPSFVFEYTDQHQFFFQEMAGLRVTFFVTLRNAKTDEQWELHLKLSKERTNLFGYLVSTSAMKLYIQKTTMWYLSSRRLPLVLDLDDTLVRVVGNEEGRHVPEHQVQSVSHRVKKIPDGRQVVLTERVEEFLEWAARYFEISVCSLGDQDYVNQVVAVLDPMRNKITGAAYSARPEFLHIDASPHPKRPPKDLATMYTFCGHMKGFDMPDGPPIDPIIIDDNVTMWPFEQQDQIIAVRETRGAPVWNVNLMPLIPTVLGAVHTEFFRIYDNWTKDPSGPVPSATRLYKEYLRAELGRRIGDPDQSKYAVSI